MICDTFECIESAWIVAREARIATTEAEAMRIERGAEKKMGPVKKSGMEAASD